MHEMRPSQRHEASESRKASTTIDADRLEDRFIQSAGYGQAEDPRALITVLRNGLPSMDSDKTLNKGLRLAVQNGHERIVNDLLESGASPNMVDGNGNSALHYNLLHCNTFDIKVVVRVVRALVLHGADLSMRNKECELLFHLAIKSKKEGLLRSMVEAAGS